MPLLPGCHGGRGGWCTRAGTCWCSGGSGCKVLLLGASLVCWPPNYIPFWSYLPLSYVVCPLLPPLVPLPHLVFYIYYNFYHNWFLFETILMLCSLPSISFPASPCLSLSLRMLYPPPCLSLSPGLALSCALFLPQPNWWRQMVANQDSGSATKSLPVKSCFPAGFAKCSLTGECYVSINVHRVWSRSALSPILLQLSTIYLALYR